MWYQVASSALFTLSDRGEVTTQMCHSFWGFHYSSMEVKILFGMSKAPQETVLNPLQF